MYTPGDRYEVAIGLFLYVRLEAAQGRRPRVGEFGAKDLLLGGHDLRWLCFHSQLLGAHAAWGWTKRVEYVDVPLADSPRTPELAPGEEPRLGAVADRQLGRLAQAGEDAGGDALGEAVVEADGDGLTFEQRV